MTASPGGTDEAGKSSSPKPDRTTCRRRIAWRVGDRVIGQYEGGPYAGQIIRFEGDKAVVKFDDGDVDDWDVDELEPEKVVSSTKPDNEESNRRGINNISRDEVMAAIRELYKGDSEPIDRDTLLISLRDYFGFGALGSNIRKELSGDITAAVKRGILEHRNGLYYLLCRTIDQYEPHFLREMFLAALGNQRNPKAWIEQEEAIVNAARYLGFKNTGPRIQELFKNAIMALIRNGDLERDGSLIRKV